MIARVKALIVDAIKANGRGEITGGILQDILLEMLTSFGDAINDVDAFLADVDAKYLSKIEPDTAQKLITFIEGLEIGDYTPGALGAGAAVKMVDGTSYAEVDNLTVRQKATFRELIIESLKHIGGQLVLTPARMKCVRVVEEDTFYKCYFDTGDGEVSNEFVAGDLARCQVFTGNGTKFYWRLVTLVGEDWINLSKTSAAVGSDAPEAGDDIVQLGNATDTTRQNAQILSTVGVDAPSWKQYKGINSFSLEGKDTTVFSGIGNKISGETITTSGGSNLDDHLVGVAQDILDALRAAQEAEDKAQQAIEDAEANVATINTEVGKLQEQLDGEVSNWFYAYSPTLANYPASDWGSSVIKDRHVGDTFTNTAQAPATDAGKSWRFVKNGSDYSWTAIADSDAVKALLEASKAQATADGKSTTYLFQPTKYKLGDMWVLNDDHTINGTLYKQGDLLTATQDSETFNEAHWLKRIRYTDDTAIDNLEIGGRNLSTNFSTWGLGNASRVLSNNNNTIILSPVDASIDAATTSPNISRIGNYIVSINVKTSGATRIYIDGRGTLLKSSHENLRYANIYFNLPSGFDERIIIYCNRTTELTHTWYMGIASDSETKSVEFSYPKLEKGDKATDWTPAPEDTQAEIDAAKKAGTDASAEVVAMESSLTEMVDTVTGALEDKVIDEAERKTLIAEQKTLDTEQERLLALVNSLLGSVYLVGDANTALSNASDATLKAATGTLDIYQMTIDVMINAAEITAAMISAYEGAYDDHKNGLSSLNVAIENARKAIDIEVKRLADEKVDALEYTSINHFSLVEFKRDAVETTANFKLEYHLEPNTKYTCSTNDTSVRSERPIYFNGLALSATVSKDNPLTTTTNSDGMLYLVLDKRGDYQKFFSGELYIQIEKGSKVTPWSPAPEDVQAEIDGLGGYMEGAFQDSVIDKAEAKAIGEHLKTINDRYVTDNAVYNNLIANPFLIAGSVRTTLQNVMQNIYRRDKPLLETAINNIINNKTVTTPLRTAFNTAFANYRSAITSFQTAVENARKAIEEQRVDNIEIGGRNLSLNFATWGLANASRVLSNNNNTIILSPVDASGDCSTSSPNISRIGDYIVSINVKTSGATRIYIDGRGTTITSSHESLRSGIYYTLPSGFNERIIIYCNRATTLNHTWYMGIASDSATKSVEFSYPKLERGNKATDWTPAPEDVDAAIPKKNLIHGGFINGFWSQGSIGSDSVGTHGRTKEVLNIEISNQYTFSILPDAHIVEDGVWITFRNADDTYHSVLFKSGRSFTFTAPAPLCTITYDATALTNHHGGDMFRDAKPMLVEGIYKSDWSPAPEDVQAEIDDVSTGLTNLGTEINTAFSNLSITNIEANNLDLLRKSLAKEVADVKAIAVSMGVSVVDIDSKISALNTEVNKYTGKADSVYPITVTTANRTAIETTFSNLEASIVALYEAIDNKRVDNIEIGGRNLTTNFSTWGLGNASRVLSNNNNTIILSPVDASIDAATTSPNISRIGNYIVSINVKTSGSTRIYIDGRGTLLKSSHDHYRSANIYYTLPSGFNERIIIYYNRTTELTNTWYMGIASDSETKSVEFSYPKLEKGTKATDWTPAPEDVDAKVQALDYLKLAIGQDGKMEGALYTIVTMLLKQDMNADVTAGISGIQGAAKDEPAFWAGGTYEQARGGTAMTIFRHDGSGHLAGGDISWDEVGNSLFTGSIQSADEGNRIVIDAGDKSLKMINKFDKQLVNFHFYEGTDGWGTSYPKLRMDLWRKDAIGGWTWDDYTEYSPFGVNFRSWHNNLPWDGRFSSSEMNISYGYEGTGSERRISINLFDEQYLEMRMKGSVISNLSLKPRIIIGSGSVWLDHWDVFVTCYNTANINVYLPSSPSLGAIKFIRRMNASNVTVMGNGKQISHGNGSISSSISAGSGRGDTAVLFWDGQYWTYNFMARDST